MVLLGSIYTNMDMEIPSCSGCYSRYICLVAISSFQVSFSCFLKCYNIFFRKCYNKITWNYIIWYNQSICLLYLYCYRLEGEAYIHYKAMLISLAIHLILLMFELLVCDQLTTARHYWILVFIPLIFISIVSIAICIWCVKHDRSYEVIINISFITFSINYITKKKCITLGQCLVVGEYPFGKRIIFKILFWTQNSFQLFFWTIAINKKL